MELCLTNYLSGPTVSTEGILSFSSAVCSKLLCLLSPCGRPYPVKKHLTKQIVAQLIAEKYLAPFELRFLTDKEMIAYMDDRGGMTLSSGCLRRMDAAAYLDVFLHELAHLYLHDREDYRNLKDLDREFRDCFREEDECVQLSPIEFYADTVALKMLDLLLEAADSDARWRIQKKREIQTLHELREKKNALLLKKEKKIINKQIM